MAMKMLQGLVAALALSSAGGAHLRHALMALSPGEPAAGNGSQASLLQGSAAAEEAVGSMVMDMLNEVHGVSISSIMAELRKKMSFEDAMQRLEGKLPKDVAALVGVAQKAKADVSEDSLQKARRVFNEMVEASYKQMDDVTMECQEFKGSNRRTFDQVVTDLARMGSEIADLDKAVARGLGCTAEQDTAFKQVKDTLSTQQNSYLKIKGANDAVLRQMKNDMAVYDFVIDVTKCAAENGTENRTSLVQLGSNNLASHAMRFLSSEPVNVCNTDDGFDLRFDNPKMEAQVMSMMTPDARRSLREALGLAFAAQPESPEALLQEGRSLMLEGYKTQCSPSEVDLALNRVPRGSSDSKWGSFSGATDGNANTMWHAADNDPNSFLVLDLGLQYQITGMKLTTPGNSPNYGWKQLAIMRSDDGNKWETVRTDTTETCEPNRVTKHAGWDTPARFISIALAQRCGGAHFAITSWEVYGCPVFKEPNCTVDVFEHGNFGGWIASFQPGAYDYPQFLAGGAKNDQVSSIRVAGPCIAVLYEHSGFNGWAASFPEGSYPNVESRGARNDAASSLKVESDTYQVAKRACESYYGTCATGQCGNFFYWYNPKSNYGHCHCAKPKGEYEFIYKNAGYTLVGQDYSSDTNQGKVPGKQLFTRRRLTDTCQGTPWELMTTLVATTTARPIPTQPPKPVVTKVKTWGKCSPIMAGNSTCGLLHDTMSLQWGKFKDSVDQLQAEIHQNQDTWEKLRTNLNEQLQVITRQKSDCQMKFDEAVASKNTLVEANNEKGREYKTLTVEYDSRMAQCKAKVEELLYTDVCAVRTVRNQLMEKSTLTPASAITDCEVAEWVAGECSKQCDDSCPAMVGREVDPYKCGGTMTLTRSAIVRNNQYGIQCPPLARTSRCAQYKCAADCKLSQWSGWSKCTKECEGGSQQQTRSVMTKPRFGGQACASAVDTRACNTMSCDRDCALAEWSKWSSCSMSCNPGKMPGFQARVRKVLVPIRGQGKCPTAENAARYQKRSCNEHLCKGDEVCVAKQDLIIAIDASGSIRESGFKIMRKFAANLVTRYRSKYYGAAAMRIGIILFGNGAKQMGDSIAPAINIVGLTDDLATVGVKVAATTWQKGFTNMAQAFVLADTMFTSGGRADAQSALLVLSDGRYSFAFETESAVRKLKDKSTEIFMAPIADSAGDWQAKLKLWSSQPWESNYQWVPGFSALQQNMDFFAAEIIAKFCPDSISPIREGNKDANLGYMLVRRGGLPDKNCASYYDLGYVNRIDDCMNRVVSEMGLKGFAVSESMPKGRHCYAQAIKVTRANYTTWGLNKVEIPCPGGAWTANAMYNTYVIEPLSQDPAPQIFQLPNTTSGPVTSSP